MSAGNTFRGWVSAVLKPHRVLSAIFLIVFVALFWVFYQSAAPQPRVSENSTDNSVSTIEVYFSAPDDPVSKTLRGGPDSQLAAAISAARYSVDVAAYNLDLWSIRDALIDAYRSGAIVRVVVEGGNLEQPEIQDLLTAGIDVVSDEHEALMHHKFIVIDQWDVWTGSMNFTINGAYRNDNNLINIRSRSMAENYHSEFEEMFIEGRFGRLSRRDTPYPILEIGSARVEVYFSPDDDPISAITNTLEQAREQVLVMAYTLTSDEIAELLVEQSQGGLDVRVLLEADQIRSTGNDYAWLKENGVNIRSDGNPYNMHHKVILIDGEVVITGSYNFTRSAEERNDENLIIVKDQILAAKYLVEFTRIWEAARP